MTRSVHEPLAVRAAWTAQLLAAIRRQRRLAYASSEAIAHEQRRRVRAAVAFAYAHVPHYRETIERPETFESPADLARLPLIERGELQRDPDRFVSDALPRERLVQIATDGSTGAPVVVLHDPRSLLEGIAHHERAEAAASSLLPRWRRVHRVIFDLSGSTIERTAVAVRARSLISPRIRYRDTRLSMKDPLADNAQRLLELAPDELRGYGSYLEAVLLELHARGHRAGLPGVACFGGDGFSPGGRRVAGELGVALFSRYGAGEAHHIGFECEAHLGLHVNSDTCPVRIVDAAGHDVPDGQPGEVVISNLSNRGTVLLNYRLGDVATRLSGGCPCGRTLPLISLPEGRTDEWLLTTGGELVHGQEVRGLLLADDAHLFGFQVEQVSPERFEIAVLARNGVDRGALAARIERRFAERFGARVQTTVSFPEQLARTPGGKVRTIVSHAGVRRPPPVAA